MFKFALIGCGRIAPAHAEEIQRTGKLIAVCDIVPEKANAFADTYGAKAYYSIDELLQAEKELDLIAICTPTGYHAEHVIKSLQASVHVISEKPLCITNAAAWQMLETEKYAERKLSVVPPATKNEQLAELSNHLQNGTFGSILKFDLKCSSNDPHQKYSTAQAFPDGGALHLFFADYLYVIAQLFGEVASVKGNLLFNGNKEVESKGAITLQMQPGIEGEINWTVDSNGKQDASLMITTEKGMIVLSGKQLEQLELRGEASTLLNRMDVSVPAASPVYRNIYDRLEGYTSGKDNSELLETVITVGLIDRIYQLLQTPAQA
jgi:UDP-N-acetyl-2-amino-2-deoxyglucuronate dehydrogenase